MNHIARARGNFLFNTTITGVHNYNKNVILTGNHGYSLQTHFAVLAVPIQEILNISFSPELPIDLTYKKTVHAYCITCFEARFDAEHWQTNGFSGFILLHDPHFLCYKAKRNTLRGLIYHNQNDDTSNAECILNRMNTEFRTLMRPLYWYQRTWQQSQIWSALPMEVWNSIVFASSGFGCSYRNRMNGAVQAGHKAAILAILTLRPQLFLREDAHILGSGFEVGENIGFWRTLFSAVMLYDILYYSFVLTCICLIVYK